MGKGRGGETSGWWWGCGDVGHGENREWEGDAWEGWAWEEWLERAAAGKTKKRFHLSEVLHCSSEAWPFTSLDLVFVRLARNELG